MTGLLQLALCLLLPALPCTHAQNQCLTTVVTEIQKLLLEELHNQNAFRTYESRFKSTLAIMCVVIAGLILGICTYDRAIKADWERETKEREVAKHLARIRAVCALHGEPACACMGKYIIAVDGAVTQEQDANELWAQQMKPVEAGEEYRDHVD